MLPPLQHAVQMVEESRHILDAIGNDLWPGWDGYKEESYFTAIPGKQDILINPPANPGNGFRPADIQIQGLPVYLRDPGKAENIWAGAYRYKIFNKRYKAVQFHPMSEEYSSRIAENYKSRYGISEITEEYANLVFTTKHYLGIIIHETSHLFQRKMNAGKIVNASHPSPFFGNPEHDNLLNLEGRILAAAFRNENTDDNIDLARQFLAVRGKRYRMLTPDDIHWERRNEFLEGMAQYIETQTWLRLSEMEYLPRVLKSDKNFDYRGSTDIIIRFLEMAIEKSTLPVSDENQLMARCYYFGMVQGFMLDRLCGQEWKQNFFEDNVYFDTALKIYSGYSDKDSSIYIAKAETRFGK